MEFYMEAIALYSFNSDVFDERSLIKGEKIKVRKII